MTKALLDEAEQLKKEIAALSGEEEIVEDVEEEEGEEEEPEPEKVEDVEETAEDAAPKEEKKEEERPDSAAFAKMRRDLAAAQKRERELLEAKEKTVETEGSEAQPLPAEVQRLVYEAQVRDAEKAFMAYENDFRKAVPDYDSISNAYKVKLFEGNMALNPRKSKEEVWEMTKVAILSKARDYLNAGYDPIEELYNDALELGITPAAQEEAQPEPKKPDMSRIAANRARNAGTAAAKGRSGSALLTREVAADMTVSEWKKLPKEERERLIRGG